MIWRKKKEPRSQRHGNIFSRDFGSMYVHVQRENGLAHHTMVLRPWQVQAIRVLTSRWFLVAVGVGAASWAYFGVQAARVPLLQWRVAHLEADSVRIDSLQKTLVQLQSRYEQVQRMLSVPAGTKSATPKSAVAADPAASSSRP